MDTTARKILIGVSTTVISGIVLLLVGNLVQCINKKTIDTTENASNTAPNTEVTGDGNIVSVGDNNQIRVEQNKYYEIQLFENPAPPKIDPIEKSLRINITEGNAGWGSTFDGDVQILLMNILDLPGYVANVTITILSERHYGDYNNLSLTSLPLEIGDYQIGVREVNRNYAVFRIVKGKK
jgi:hypothetical protein